MWKTLDEVALAHLNRNLCWANLSLFLVLVWRSFAETFIIKTHTSKHILKAYSSFLLVNRPEIRTKVILSLKAIYCIEVESNCLRTSNKEKFCLYPLNSVFTLLLRSLFLCFFNRYDFGGVHPILLLNPCLISICFCVMSLTIEVKFLAAQWWRTNSYSRDLGVLLVQFLFDCPNVLLNNLRQVVSCHFIRISIWLRQHLLNKYMGKVFSY